MTSNCPRCGTQLLSTGSPPAICPRCVLALAVPQVDARTASVKGYNLIRVLGEGGMGIVYLAEEQQPPGRTVALKVIRAGMDSKQVVARFEREQQALALMDHPCIAKVLGVGETEQGLPYFAMEYIEGEPITTYCDRNTLNTRERLQLFMQVCDGVQHAHQKGVIHRDLKPSNILVAQSDTGPIPKIIDFGVAKATAQEMTVRTFFTELGMLIGTPEYMSPEQAGLAPADVDTRSDVYTLGMVLYELLAGTLPFDARELRKAGLDEIRRRIREVDAPRPSARVQTLGDGSSETARNRKTEPHHLVSQLKGDLDWITMKALEKDRNRRYGSPLDLAADVQRYIENEPVSVGPPSVGYRLSKFVRRHRPHVVAAALIGLAIIGGLISTAIGFSRAVRAERQAHDEATHAAQEAVTANTVIDLLVGIFQSPDPSMARGKMLDARDILQRGTERVLHGLESQPLVRARMMDVIGFVDANLGRYDEAKQLLSGALEIRRQHMDRDNPAIGESLDSLGHLQMEMDHPEQALHTYKEALLIRQRSLDPSDPRVGASLSNVGVALRDLERGEEARPFLEQALTLRLKVLPASDLGIAESHMNLANVLSDLNLNSEATDHYQRALEVYDRVDPNNPDRAIVLDDLGAVKATSQGPDSALPLHQEALAIRQRVLPPLHPDIAISLINTANDMFELKRYKEAKPYYEKAIAIYDARPELGRRYSGLAHGNLSSLLVATRRFQESERHLDQARKILVALDGANSGDLADILEYRAGALRTAGRLREADKSAAEVKHIREHVAHRQK